MTELEFITPTVRFLLISNGKDQSQKSLVIQFISDNKRKRYSLGVKGASKDWDSKAMRFKKSANKKTQNEREEKNLVIETWEAKYKSYFVRCKQRNIPFNWNDLDRALKGEDSSHLIGSVMDVFEQKINEVTELIKKQQAGTGTRNSIINTRNNFKLFLEAKGYSGDTNFATINSELLKDFERYLRSPNRKVYRWMRKANKYKKVPATTGVSQTTLGIYMRNMRTIWNLARKKGYTTGLKYPFDDYKIKSGRPSEEHYRYLSEEEISNLIIHQGKIADRGKYESLLYWLTSFYANGANMADICRWQWGRQVKATDEGYRVTYQRTKNRSKENQLTAILEDQNLNAIREYFKSQPTAGSYVFPVLIHTIGRNGETLTENQIESAYKTRLKSIVRDIRELCKEVGIEKPQQIDFYTARHSFAVIEYKATKDIYLLQNKLLHTNITTTEKYLRSLGLEFQLRASEASKKLPFSIMLSTA